jgi:hypothetical protein
LLLHSSVLALAAATAYDTVSDPDPRIGDRKPVSYLPVE